MKVRTEVLGAEHVARAQARQTPFDADFQRYITDGQFKNWVKAVQDGKTPEIDPGPPLTGDPPGPTEVITDTKAPAKK